jgi:hypothetical protein
MHLNKIFFVQNITATASDLKLFVKIVYATQFADYHHLNEIIFNFKFPILDCLHLKSKI